MRWLQLPLTCALTLMVWAETPLQCRADEDPPLPDASAQVAREIQGLKRPAGLKIELFAAEPQLGNPVALTVDEKGRVFVAEEYRFNRGTEENRTSSWLLEDDLQIRTIEDRLTMFRRHASHYADGMNWFTKYSDKIRLLEDRNGDGRADYSSEFARFGEPLDGLAAGVLARRGDIYATCIPNLWRFRDPGNTGKATEREKVLTGFGVNAAYLGHDLHGLTWGPDGKLYFSVGDRGYNIVTKEGQTISDVRTGSVFRCNPDGTELEAIFRGLRNPQELVFDQYGNLFAGDNNCDQGDASRLMYIVDGGDGGWRMEYQSLKRPYLTGPWLTERMWETEHATQPAFLLPPAGPIGTGPSGFAYYPGTGLPDKFRNHFFLCNFTGNGGIETFTVEPNGAGFRLTNPGDFLKPLLASDLEFGYDGKIYVSHFGNLIWKGGNGGGRVYTLFDPQKIQSDEVKQVRELFAKGFDNRTTEELGQLLEHADQRVRREAQFSLAERLRKIPEDKQVLIALSHALLPDKPLTTRMHALWAFGQIAREDGAARDAIAKQLKDTDPEIRANAARLVGSCQMFRVVSQLVPLLKDSSPRVRMWSAISLGKLNHVPAVPELIALLAESGDDAYVRHGAVMGLIGCSQPAELHQYERDSRRNVRLGVLLAERRRKDPHLALFLQDSDPLIATEAARAINDLQITGAYSELARSLRRILATGPALVPDAFLRRAINANFRLGGDENARLILALALDARCNEAMRSEAISALSEWEKPSPRDRVDGFWRPLPPRSAEPVRELVRLRLNELLACRGSADLQTQIVRFVASLNLGMGDESFTAWVRDGQKHPATRVAALRYLSQRPGDQIAPLLKEALAGSEPLLRAEARDLLVDRDPNSAYPELEKALDSSESPVIERQRALASLSRMSDSRAGAKLLDWMTKLADDKAPPELKLDINRAVRGSQSKPPINWQSLEERRRKRDEPPGDPLGRYRISLYGGNPENGRALFAGSGRVQCTRCHKVGNEGGVAGPDLSKVATRHTPEALLESLILPDNKIAPGYGSIAVSLISGKVLAGTIKKESPSAITLETSDGKQVEIPLSEIEERTAPKSAMPAVSPDDLNLRDFRDLMAYLTSLK